MLALLVASKQSLDALVWGQDDIVARNAQNIHDSFIVAQKMTEAEPQGASLLGASRLHRAGRSVHALSERLAQAARKTDRSQQRELCYEMLDGCVGCHAAHATGRFPSLAEGAR